MGSGDVPVKTRGEVLTEKFTNFVAFCTINLPLSKEEYKDTQLAKQATPEQIMYALRTNLLPHKELVLARDIDSLKRLDELPPFVHLIGQADEHVQDKIWRYLELFCELCSFSEANEQ